MSARVRLRPPRWQPLRRSPRARRGDERGETLLELTITIAILGLGVTSILGAVLAATDASTMDQRQVQAQSRLRSWAEQLVTLPYVECATTTGYQTGHPYSGLSLPELPPGFTAGYAAVHAWNGNAFQDTAGMCTPGVDDRGLQRVRLRMEVAASLYPGFTSDLWVTVRKPCSAATGSEAC